MKHKCERKEGKIIEMLIDNWGNLYCKSCFKKLEDGEINCIELAKIRRQGK